MKVAFVGTGNMGAPMAKNLLKAGHKVNILERSRSSRIMDLADSGAQLCKTSAECGENCDVAILMLPSSREVTEVVEGRDGLARSLSPESTLIDCSTSLPSQTKTLGARLAARKVHMVDAPVVRGIKGAEAGKLAFFIGGEEEPVSNIMPLLQALGDTFIRVGDLGAGHTVKILNNLLSLSHLVLLSEVLELSERNDVGFDALVAALMSGNARSATLEQHAERTASSIRENVRFKIALAAKDLHLAAELSTVQGLSNAPSKYFSHVYAKAVEHGLGEEDITTIREVLHFDA